MDTVFDEPVANDFWRMPDLVGTVETLQFHNPQEVEIFAVGRRPAWLEHVVGRLNSIALLEDDWDGEGAVAPTATVFTAALGALETVMPEAVPRPAVVPTGTGGIQFEWHQGGWNIEIEVESDGVVTAWARSSDRENRLYGELNGLGNEVRDILELLAGSSST